MLHQSAERPGHAVQSSHPSINSLFASLNSQSGLRDWFYGIGWYIWLFCRYFIELWELFFCLVELGQVGVVIVFLLVTLFNSRHKYRWKRLLPTEHRYCTSSCITVTLFHVWIELLRFASINFQIADASNGAIRSERPLISMSEFINVLFLFRLMPWLVTAFRCVIRYFRHTLRIVRKWILALTMSQPKIRLDWRIFW